jgi:uncharacterized protein with beta-barrel porin domain
MRVRVFRRSMNLLLASSSVAALAVGAGAPPARAACTLVTGSSAGFTNPVGNTITCVHVNNATVSGSVVNAGKITTPAPTNTAILVTNSTITGAVANSGTISSVVGIAQTSGTIVGGISNGGLIASRSGISIGNGNVISLAGGVSNSGTISGGAGSFGIAAISPGGTLTGGITNSGTVAGHILGLQAGGFANFSGGMSNNGGTITVASGIGMQVTSNSTFAGSVTNSGRISSFASGIEIGVNPAFLGGIVNSGTISSAVANGIAAGSSVQFGSSSAAGGITNIGSIAAGQNGIFVDAIQTFVGAISNAGTISAAMVGIKIFQGVTFAAGGAIVNSGTITGGTAAIDVTQATSPVTINQVGGLISGAINLSSHADVLNVTGGTIAGNIVGAGSSDTVNFAPGAGNTFVYGPGFGFSGINQVNINSGTVVLNGVNSATNIDVAGGTLAGTGTLDPLAVTIHSGATFAPGNGTPGTSMTITGNLVFQSGATYQVQLNPSTASFANVSLTATLGGSVLAIFAPGSYVTRQYTILQSGGLSGTFAGVTTQGAPAGVTASLSYNTDDVFLDLALALPTTGLNVNQANVANAITGFFNGGGALPPGFAGIIGLTGGNLGGALTKLDGEAATDAQKGAFNLMTGFLNLMLDPFAGGRNTLGGGGATAFAPEQPAALPPDVALAYASVLKAPPKPATFDQRWSMWGAAFGGYNTTKGNATIGSNDVAASDFGFAAGADYRVGPDTTLGFALAGGGTGWSLAQNLGSGRSDAFAAGIYATTRRGPAYLAGALGFANHWLTTDRFAPADHLQASFDGQSYGARLEGGYRLAVPAGDAVVGVTPYLAAQTQRFRTPAYSEQDLTGGGFGLAYAAMSATDTRGEVGARFDALKVIDHMPVILHARAAWAHDWVSNPALGAVFQALPGASFTVNGAAAPKNSALVSAGAELAIARGWSLDARFDGEFASGAQTYTGTGTLRHTW